ncbi:MAG: cyclic nucleotide-binding domain-containing protein, partial [Anaerolineae bacterium]|nr:cyclic nucleotide-binding domain-containing protein [Anaerolineae bacterium]
MEPKEIVEHLKHIPLFKNLTDKRGELELYHMVEEHIVHEVSHDIGEWLFNQGKQSTQLYMILEGKLRLTRVNREGVQNYLKDVGPGDVFGETGLLLGDVHDATAEVIEPARVLYLEQAEFAEFLDKHEYTRKHLKISPHLARRKDVQRYDWMREDEWVVFAAKRHWAYLLRKTGPPLLLLIIFLPLLYLLADSEIPAKGVFSVILGLYLMMLTGLIIYQYYNWKDDLFVMTTQRIVHIERMWPLKQSFEESTLNNIQDIYELRPNFAANVLNFGDLILQTAGETVQIDMLGVPAPDKLRELIFREIERYRALDVLRSRGSIKGDLVRRLNLEPPPTTAEEETSKTERASIITLALHSLLDYFFPSSWIVAKDESTIIWRRYWAPGFIHYLKFLVPLIIITIGGVLYLNAIWESANFNWILGVWLIIEAGLFGASLWFLEDWRNDYYQVTKNR